MAGQPTFRRAKRFTYFHTDYHAIYEGAVNHHVKTNQTASVDGNSTEAITGNKKITAANASIDSALDFMRNKILRPKNVLRTEKITIAHGNLTATSSQTLTLFRASPGDTVYDILRNITSPLASGSTLGRYAKVSVGDAGDPDGFGKSIGLGTPSGWDLTTQTYINKGEYIFNASPFYREFKTYTSATLIQAVFNASGKFLASLDGGSIDFYIDVMSRA